MKETAQKEALDIFRSHESNKCLSKPCEQGAQCVCGVPEYAKINVKRDALKAFNLEGNILITSCPTDFIMV
ncbi:hypothetical protein WH96_05560 [Kiloniella spongiae]|uniref:Uncharacterized protein n=1 Tax=Kiloniella spongiae TaxID=1489064 RepID=A0A0H2MH82_9PROT|nr:hypothetical protein WH96_05560 [Kiloniella spongiae]